MEIKRTAITVRDLAEGYVNDSEIDIEQGVYAYGGKLCVRPAFQRSFVYDKAQESAVIDTTIKGFPLNIMYWVDNGDGTYDCLDGQQRTISLCNFVDGISSSINKWFNITHSCPDDFRLSYATLKRKDPDLLEKFLDYELEVYICKGTKAEQMEWFRTINIAGEELSDQELRNANYVSEWLTDAKRYFSKATSSSTAKCPAERVGGQYTKKNANRQEVLEQVITWFINSEEDADICNYMESRANDSDASELWNYFNDVIKWIETIFAGEYDKGMKSVNWGFLYNNYKDQEFDPEVIWEDFSNLMILKANGDIDASAAKIIEYCITKDETLLKRRHFNDVQRLAKYNSQNGLCAHCGKPFALEEMEAHHIVSWRKGGPTKLENCEMICKDCHHAHHAN